jgi:hypothetical protein
VFAPQFTCNFQETALQVSVFVSYSRKDRDAVAAIVTALRAAGEDVWVDLEGTVIFFISPFDMGGLSRLWGQSVFLNGRREGGGWSGDG